jgi:hypothetical protein
MKSQRTECTLHLSYDTRVWLRPLKEKCSIAAEMEKRGTDVENKEFYFQFLLNSSAFTFLSLRSAELNN